MPQTLQTDAVTRWHRVETLFHRAAKLPAADRPATLTAWCADEPALVAEVLELLDADLVVEDKLARSAHSTVATGSLIDSSHAGNNLNPAAPAARADPWIGRTLGQYRVQSELGSGGMGVVYLGQHVGTSPHPRAAIKVVRRNLQDSPALGHFLLERDTLARLEHPNIARLLDGGVTAEGIPWLVLEYVEGRRLDHMADQPGTTIETLLDRILQLCAAVAYVHRNLILHRDLKPGNVMVKPEGIVKLLDFGTLKMLQKQSPSDMTQAGMRPVTLRFASPEHVRGERVSTASDVYSLGVILYRLIAGRYPEAASEPEPDAVFGEPLETRNQAVEAGPGGLFEQLRAGRILPPSRFSPLTLRPAMARDLDAIVMKAMRYEADARYQTADALAADLRRALEDRPVEALGEDRRYRARKFYQRHRPAVLTAVATLLALTFGLIGMARETHAARAEQVRAEVGVSEERQLAHLLLFDYFGKVQQIAGSTAAQHETVAQTSAYLDQLDGHPALRDPVLELYEVQGYTKLANVLGNSFGQNLGDPDAAVRALGKAISLSDRLLAADSGNLALLDAGLEARRSLGLVYLGPGNVERADQVLSGAVPLEQSILTNPRLAATDFVQLGAFEATLGDLNFSQGAASLGDGPAAIEHHLHAIELDRKALILNPACARCRFEIATEHFRMGSTKEDMDPVAAGDEYRLALADIAAMSAAEQRSPQVERMSRRVEQHLGIVEASTGAVDHGVALMAAARDHFRSSCEADPVDLQSRFDWFLGDANLSLMEIRAHRFADARDTLIEEIAVGDTLARKDPKNAIWVMRSANARIFLDEALTALGQPAAALEQREQALPVLLRFGIVLKPSPPFANRVAKVLERVQGDPALELLLARSSVAHTRVPNGEQLVTLAYAERRAGNRTASLAAATRAEAVLRSSTGTYNAALLIEARRLSGSLAQPVGPPI